MTNSLFATRRAWPHCGQILDSLALDTGVLVIFDRRADAPPMAERIALGQAQTPSGRTITLLRG